MKIKITQFPGGFRVNVFQSSQRLTQNYACMLSLAVCPLFFEKKKLFLSVIGPLSLMQQGEHASRN